MVTQNDQIWGVTVKNTVFLVTFLGPPYLRICNHSGFRAQTWRKGHFLAVFRVFGFITVQVSFFIIRAYF